MKSKEFIENLSIWAEEYITECLNNKKDVATGSGKIVNIKDRHIPTIDYFLNIWLPFNKYESIARRTYYNWLQSEDEHKMHTIKKIDDMFKSLAGDIVANEGKGIFYAKNKLGWSDKQIQDINLKNVNADFGQTIQSTPKSEDNS